MTDFSYNWLIQSRFYIATGLWKLFRCPIRACRSYVCVRCLHLCLSTALVLLSTAEYWPVDPYLITLTDYHAHTRRWLSSQFNYVVHMYTCICMHMYIYVYVYIRVCIYVLYNLFIIAFIFFRIQGYKSSRAGLTVCYIRSPCDSRCSRQTKTPLEGSP